MHDISEGGVAFWSRRVFPIRRPIYVREYTPSKPGVWLAAEVTHCTLGIRGYLIGVQFALAPAPSAAPKGSVNLPERGPPNRRLARPTIPRPSTPGRTAPGTGTG